MKFVWSKDSILMGVCDGDNGFSDGGEGGGGEGEKGEEKKKESVMEASLSKYLLRSHDVLMTS